jgi:hypothetical protein
MYRHWLKVTHQWLSGHCSSGGVVVDHRVITLALKEVHWAPMIRIATRC